MSHIPAGYLKKDRKHLEVSLADIVVLMSNLQHGADEEDVGFEDAQETVDTITRKLNRKVWMDPALLESGLWSCNLRSEAGRFWHPNGLTFDQFVRDLLKDVPNLKFNTFYNVIEEKK